MKDKIIHFGEFVRWNRVKANKTTDQLAREIGLTARRLIAIEAMAVPTVQHRTLAAMALAFGFDPETFEDQWKQTPVPVTRRKIGPTTDEATRFNAACVAAGTTPAEGQRRLRSWIIEQDPAVQKAALSYISPRHQHDVPGSSDHESSFTDPVDHLQDPATEVANRVAAKAAQVAANQTTTSPPSHRP